MSIKELGGVSLVHFVYMNVVHVYGLGLTFCVCVCGLGNFIYMSSVRFVKSCKIMFTFVKKIYIYIIFIHLVKIEN